MDDSFSYSFIGDKNAKICLEIGFILCFVLFTFASCERRDQKFILLFWDSLLFIYGPEILWTHAHLMCKPSSCGRARKSVTASGKVYFNNR